MHRHRASASCIAIAHRHAPRHQQSAYRQHRHRRSEIRQLGNLAAWRVRDNAAPLCLPPCRFTLFCRQSPATKTHDAAPTTHAAWAAPWSPFLPHHRARCFTLFSARQQPAASHRHQRSPVSGTRQLGKSATRQSALGSRQLAFGSRHLGIGTRNSALGTSALGTSAPAPALSIIPASSAIGDQQPAISVSTYQRISVPAYQRISVSAYQRISVSAYQRIPPCQLQCSINHAARFSVALYHSSAGTAVAPLTSRRRSSPCARLAPAARSRARAPGPLALSFAHTPPLARNIAPIHALMLTRPLSYLCSCFCVTRQPIRSHPCAATRSRAPLHHVRYVANRYPLNSGSKLAALSSVPTTTTCAPLPPLSTILKISYRVDNDIDLLCCTHAC